MGILMVILTILKIIGIILLSVLGLILFILLLVLFVPVRYKGEFVYDEKPWGKGSVHYLLHLFAVKFQYGDAGLEYSVRVLWFRLFEPKEKKSRKSVKKPAKAESKDDLFSEDFPKEDSKEAKTESAEPSVAVPKLEVTNQEARTITDPPSFSRKEPEKKKKPEAKQKPKQKPPKKEVFKKFKQRYNDFKKNFASFVEKRDKILKEYEDEGNRRAVSRAFRAVGKVLRHVLPKKHRIRICFGTGDPATTGEILGAGYAASFMLGLNLTVLPDFENKRFSADGYAKGRIRVATLLYIGARLYFNKDVKALIKKIRAGIL